MGLVEWLIVIAIVCAFAAIGWGRRRRGRHDTSGDVTSDHDGDWLDDAD
jgi:hypothetical protein